MPGTYCNIFEACELQWCAPYINILTLKGIFGLVTASYSLSIHENGSSKKGYAQYL